MNKANTLNFNIWRTRRNCPQLKIGQTLTKEVNLSGIKENMEKLQKKDFELSEPMSSLAKICL